MQYSAGMLRHRVILQTVTETRDAGGGATDAWANTATVWAAIDTPEARENYDAGQLQAKRIVQVVIRHRTVTQQQRFKFGTRYFYITATNNVDERSRWLVCTCEERNVTV